MRWILAMAVLAVLLVPTAQAAKPNPITEYGAKPNPITEYGKARPYPGPTSYGSRHHRPL